MTLTKLSAKEVLSAGPVVPVLVVSDVAAAIPLAKALIAGGIKVLEVTLRTPQALDVIKAIADHVPEAIIGAGTVTTPEMLQQVIAAGGQFAISPGLTEQLLQAGNDASIPLIPGIASVSELMTGLDAGYDTFKFFPAEASGGVKALKSIVGPFPHVTFCPTGGITPAIYNDYLAIPNVRCVGGSWMVPSDAIASGDWEKITELATLAVEGVTSSL